MTERAKRLNEAQAALFLGFAKGCARRGIVDDARAFEAKAIELCPAIYDVLEAEPFFGPRLMSMIEAHGRSIATDEMENV